MAFDFANRIKQRVLDLSDNPLGVAKAPRNDANVAPAPTTTTTTTANDDDPDDDDVGDDDVAATPPAVTSATTNERGVKSPTQRARHANVLAPLSTLAALTVRAAFVVVFFFSF